MKKLLIFLMLVISSNIEEASVAQGAGVGRSTQIDESAKARLQLLLDNKRDGFSAKLQKVISATSEQLSLQELQQRAFLKKHEFETMCSLATQDVQQRAVIILKDYNVDAGNAYQEYLEGEYADSIHAKAQEALKALQDHQESQVQAALQREKDTAYVASRPLKLGRSLLTNIVYDAREDFSKAAVITGAGAVALPYVPVKTREKLEEGVGSVLVKHPGYAAASLAVVFAGWQGIKYGMRYLSYRNQAADFEAQAQSVQLEPEWNEKAVFLAFVPGILQSARDGATIVHLVKSSQSAQQELKRLSGLVEQQDRSLQSLQTFAQAHGASLEGVREKLGEVCARQQAHMQTLGSLCSEFGNQRSDIRDIKKGVGQLLALRRNSAKYPYDADSEDLDSASVGGFPSAVAAGCALSARASSVRSQNFSLASCLSGASNSVIAQMVAPSPHQSLSVRMLGPLASLPLEPESHRVRSARRVQRGTGLQISIPGSCVGEAASSQIELR